MTIQMTQLKAKGITRLKNIRGNEIEVNRIKAGQIKRKKQKEVK